MISVVSSCVSQVKMSRRVRTVMTTSSNAALPSAENQPHFFELGYSIQITLNDEKPYCTINEGNDLDISKLQQGQDFIAEIDIRNSSSRTYIQDIALSQIFPSGWEIINDCMDEGPSAVEADRPPGPSAQAAADPATAVHLPRPHPSSPVPASVSTGHCVISLP